MGITQFLIEKATWIIDLTGHPGIAVLMMFESMIAPIPSEAVMPFAGWLVATGRFTFLGVFISSTIGSIVGSLLSYWIGYYGGRPLVEKFGKYLLLNSSDLEATERFFSKYGSPAIFIGRFIPVVRHLISLPAGAGKMKLLPFCIYTTIGASAWNMFLAWVGFKMEGYRELIHHYSRPVDVVVVLVILAGAAYFVKSHLKRG
ncbi:DedA family protein [Desulforegula conservatrix]|uniref:DedA family protein n=1 Tax=Desulforegula conservatrix TaxID=153026 RepID=UPI00041DCE93|nr:DedA family protein [Desulforegula conservatrix]